MGNQAAGGGVPQGETEGNRIAGCLSPCGGMVGVAQNGDGSGGGIELKRVGGGGAGEKFKGEGRYRTGRRRGAAGGGETYTTSLQLRVSYVKERRPYFCKIIMVMILGVHISICAKEYALSHVVFNLWYGPHMACR